MSSKQDDPLLYQRNWADGEPPRHSYQSLRYSFSTLSSTTNRYLAGLCAVATWRPVAPLALRSMRSLTIPRSWRRTTEGAMLYS